MANAETANATTQCKALTADGERCSRPAQDDGFCFQHDESDPTVSEADDAAEEQDADQEPAQDQDQEQAQDQQKESQEENQAQEQEQGHEQEQPHQTDTSQPTSEMASDETTDPDAVDTDELDIDTESDVDTDQIEGILAIRRTVVSTAGELIGHEFDGVSEISPTDEGWCAVVEVVERSAVPDTQDVLGRYEIDLNTDGVVQGYRRLDRYRRGDTTVFE
ncbi:gas vesicle protein GvpO, halophile-type [Natrialba taiwanensis]|uniref:Gas vesicle synthesis family protein n=1 Tax=Natrialba taiwanensis DSM 12281 TaxID=1230458 RepID=M0A9H7_9EURY|nr:gas vesicle protein [Natrialba taiwanensis]ELY95435.1 gas vesicle synthesis family protein [Natrialba taiwanensis DSM 12281]